MRRRNIKTVAHWVIMCFILLFPILMVGVSAFANDEQSVTVTETYEYETNDVSANNDIVIGNVYNVDLYNLCLPFGWNASSDDYFVFEVIQNGNLSLNFSDFDLIDTGYVDLDLDNHCNIEIHDDLFIVYFYEFDYYFTYQYNIDGVIDDYMNDSASLTVLVVDYNLNNGFNDISTNFTASDYLGEVTTAVDIQNSNYKQEVNNWANGFKRLPVNQWYGQLLDVIGVGQTTNSVMNVMYVYPLYVLWVYLLDLILDCLLVIVNLGHNALKRLDNEVE